jgi:RimJ/RimL family protein N-acetyltransferase
MSSEKKEEKQIEPFIFIKGDLVDLVAQRSEWSDLYCKWINDPRVRHYSRNPMPRTLEEIKKWNEPPQGEGMRDWIVMTVYHKKDRKPIGTIGLNHINWLNRWANAFIQIGETEYWGKNVATEATKLLLKYAFEEVNLHKVSGGVAIDNVGSWTVAEKVGFEFEGILKDEFYLDGKYIDVKRYRYLKEDWLKKNNQ